MALLGLSNEEKAVSTEKKIDTNDPQAIQQFAQTLRTFMEGLWRPHHREVIILCIGTDRSTGDSLGPLIGSLLSEEHIPGVTILGTLDSPVHATNLAEKLEEIKALHPHSFIVAIDACLGRLESIGMITVGMGALRPGAGVNKSLPCVGDIYITGVVNVGGFMEYFVLQNTRLSLVMKMAKTISSGIAATLAAGFVQEKRESASAMVLEPSFS